MVVSAVRIDLKAEVRFGLLRAVVERTFRDVPTLISLAVSGEAGVSGNNENGVSRLGGWPGKQPEQIGLPWPGQTFCDASGLSSAGVRGRVLRARD